MEGAWQAEASPYTVEISGQSTKPKRHLSKSCTRVHLLKLIISFNASVDGQEKRVVHLLLVKGQRFFARTALLQLQHLYMLTLSLVSFNGTTMWARKSPPLKSFSHASPILVTSLLNVLLL